MKGKRWAIWLLLWIAGGLFFWMAGQCNWYTVQNRSLTAENGELSAVLAERKQTIDKKAEEIESLQAQLADALSLEEQMTKNGFCKKNGIYMIDTKEQLFKLQEMLREGIDVEPGTPAASASYRLRNNMKLESNYWFCLGTEENPFCGTFDGDGHSIQGRFPHGNGVDAPEAVFHMDAAAKIENLKVDNDRSDGEISVWVDDNRECEELENHLPGVSGCSVHVEISEWGLDAERIAKALRRHWERGDWQDGFYVSMTFFPDMFEEDQKPADAEKDIQNMKEALCTLAGPEYTGMIREAMEQDEGYLWFVRLERIGELTCCTFEIDEPAYSPDTYDYFDEEADDFVYTNVGYYIAVEGKWEGKEVSRQCIRVPYTFNIMRSIGVNLGYRMEVADFDFDGKQDLLIHEGSSGGSGGSWYNCRALVWKAAAGQFAYFPSFPENVHLLQFDRQRVVDRGDVGMTDYVLIYEIVNGEYVCTRKLLCEFHTDDTYKLSYYEMGELVETHILSDVEERELLYPDMNYWMQG